MSHHRAFSVKFVLILTLFLTALLSDQTLAQSSGSGAERPHVISPHEYLTDLIYSPEEVNQWLAGTAFPFAKYDAELGWLLPSMRRLDGVDGSISTYNYDGPLGARRLINAADQPGRINTYGDSFTQCDQVSDGETWQEQLAAHIGEPVRNYGVGGYSVYQAYLRMRRVERTLPSKLIIFNIYEDDHYRNLDSWRNIRVSKHRLFIEPTLPHIRVELSDESCTEVPNPCPTSESVQHLSDPAWVHERFKDDFVLKIMLSHRNAQLEAASIASTNPTKTTAIGINTRVDEGRTISVPAEMRHTRAALLSSIYVVDKVEEFARQANCPVLYVLSYRDRTVTRHLKRGTRFDQEFINFLQQRKLNYVDLLEAHAADYSSSSLSPESYVARYFIGHYNSTGNFFTARAIKDKAVQQLDPPPPAYHYKATDYWKKN